MDEPDSPHWNVFAQTQYPHLPSRQQREKSRSPLSIPSSSPSVQVETPARPTVSPITMASPTSARPPPGQDWRSYLPRPIGQTVVRDDGSQAVLPPYLEGTPAEVLEGWCLTCVKGISRTDAEAAQASVRGTAMALTSPASKRKRARSGEVDASSAADEAQPAAQPLADLPDSLASRSCERLPGRIACNLCAKQSNRCEEVPAPFRRTANLMIFLRRRAITMNNAERESTVDAIRKYANTWRGAVVIWMKEDAEKKKGVTVDTQVRAESSLRDERRLNYERWMRGIAGMGDLSPNNMVVDQAFEQSWLGLLTPEDRELVWGY